MTCKIEKGVLLLLLCSISIGIYAQQPNDTLAGKMHHLPEVSVRAPRVMPALTATSPLQQMQRTELERLGIVAVADAVRHFAGVSVKDYGGIGGLKTVSVRSLGAQHTAVSYDDVAVSDCQSGQVDISRFSLDNVSALTLTIGQNDNIYRTARMFAAAGVLNIETIQPTFDKHPFSLTANLRAGSFGYVNPSLMLARQLSRRVSLAAYADYLRADGNYPFKMRNGNKLINARRNNSDIDTWRAELNLFAALNDRQDLKAKFYLFDSGRGLPGGVIYDNPYAAERLYDRNYFAQLSYENRFSARWKLKAAGKYNYTWNRDYNNQSSGITDNRFRQQEGYLSGVLWGAPIRYLSFSLAQDFAYNTLSNTFPNCQFPRRFTSLTVLAGHYRLQRFTATASLLNTYITERVRTGTAAPDRRRLSPAVSLSWLALPREGIRLRASYQDIFRTPTFNDLYFLSSGSRNLRPETTRQFNVGATWNASTLMPIDLLTLSVDGYYNKVKDKIVAVPTMFVWQMMNVGEVETLGIDANLTAEWQFASKCHLYLNGAYSFMRAVDTTDPDSKTWHNQMVYTPRHSGSGSLTLENPYVNITYNLMYASARYTLAQNLPENRIAPYTDHGVSLSHTFRWKKQSLRIQFDALNLGGKNYEIIRFYPMAGRNYKISINYKL
ncbi:MAG: TonB-dependent receptor [Prevotellaceae bacterium]|jgi:outer membrane cobalamin receptor|nr:TonB-dependent receptor [Prevotellaceae bacterium]